MNVDKTLQSLLEEGKSYALNLFQEDGSVETTAIVTTLREHFLLIQDKEQHSTASFRDAVESVIRQEKALGVCMVAEIWYDTVPNHFTLLSTDENAEGQREGILVCAEDSSGNSVCALSEIRRDGNQVEVSDWKKLGSMAAQSIFTAFFGNKKPVYIN